MKSLFSRRLASLLMTLALLLGVTTFASPAPVAASVTCGTVTGYLALYKHVLGGPDCLVFDSGDWYGTGRLVSLVSPWASPPGSIFGENCDGQYGYNDCVSAIKLSGPCTYGFALYVDDDGTGLLYSAWGAYTKTISTFGYNDTASSVKLLKRTTCPLSTGTAADPF